jgi:hypothetical protein
MVAVIFLLLIAVLAVDMVAFGQNRPRVVDAGEVKETSRKTVAARRPRLAKKSSQSASSALLIIQTDPEDAEIKIDGKPAGKASGGMFPKELPSGRKYTVEVSAGPDYEPFKEVVSLLKSGGYEILDADLTAKYGVVRIGPALKDAKIFVDDKPVPPDNLRVDKDSNTIIISRLLPGAHTIAYDHPDYAIVERKFNIEAGSEYTRILELQRATTELSVATDPGTAVFLDSRPLGKTPADGKLVLADVGLGSHEIKLVKDGYEEYKERRQFEFRNPVAVTRRLVPLPTSAEFSDDFDVVNVKRWTMPASGWNVISGRLNIANAPVLGFPTGIQYRNFEMQFHLKLTDGRGAAWAVRARDASSYYLFYLSGPEGLFKNRFNVYIVRDNKLDLSNYVQSVPVIAKLEAGGEYTINVKVLGDEIGHTITPASTGIAENFGSYKDPDKTFVIGGIGFRTVGPEKFSVDDLFVRPLADSSGK